jgi:hypothetical protein
LPKARALDKGKELTFFEELIELAYAVSAVLFVLEIDGVPGTFLRSRM